MAHKKGQGSSRNGRDSNAQRRGVKVFGGQACRAGSIIVRQVGTRFHAGPNTALGSDYTVFSLVDGHVRFETRKKRGKSYKQVTVGPIATEATAG